MQSVGEILQSMMRKGNMSPAAGNDLRRIIYEARQADVWVDIQTCPNCRKELWVYDFTGKQTEKIEPRRYVFDRFERSHDACGGKGLTPDRKVG